MSRITLSTGRISITFGPQPLAIASIVNEATGEKVMRSGTHEVILRLPHRISEPVFLTEVVSFEKSPAGVRWLLEDQERRHRVVLEASETPDGIRIDAHVEAAVPVWLLEWRIRDLDAREIVLPALGGQSLGSRMPRDTTLSFKYPFWWNAQFVLAPGKGGGFWLRTMDREPIFKLVRVKRTGPGFQLTYGIEATAPLVSTTLSGSWYLDCYRGSWRVPTETHRAWMEGAFGLLPLAKNSMAPAWSHDIDFVLELWGMGKETPVPMHTFAQMESRIKAFRPLHDPRRTLLYLPGFAEHGIDSRAPQYNPGEALGGRDGFLRLVDLAHRLGYRVMPHTNVLCLTFEHPEYDRFRDAVVADAFGQQQGWALDIDGDWLAEPYFSYINPGVRAWGDLMEGVIGELVNDYGADAIFLDQTLLAFNVSRGPNFVTGMREHVQRLQNAFPRTLFAGEGLHEQVVAALPFAQIHGIDSISEVHGLEGRARWRQAHPVSTTLFGPYTHFCAHLLTRHPEHHFFALQEAAYERLGVIPALCLYSHTQPMEHPGTRRMLRRSTVLRKSRS